MNRFSFLSVTAVVASVLLVAGCAPVPGEPEESAEPTVLPTVTVTAPAPEPEAPRADYGFTFFEEATMGSTWAQMSSQLNYPVAGIDEPWNDAVCPHYGLVWGTELVTTYAFMDEGKVGFFYTNRLFADDSASFPRNAEGVGVGSTEAQILAAYPTAVVGDITDLGAGDIHTITVDDPDSDSKYVFGITSGSAVVDLLQWGPLAGNQWSHLCGGF
ncbi:MAG TPA: hypothetical protein PK781_01730 [Terrimesophilobacter sp.]|nr:hypothetical protein [Terrimesophilobacter sp.]HRP99162.1 hypothetical protein [Terrimesophilobacter sp.]